MTALKEEKDQEVVREYEKICKKIEEFKEAWKKLKEAWSRDKDEVAKKKLKPTKHGESLSDEGTEFSLSTILRDLLVMWTISSHTACTPEKCQHLAKVKKILTTMKIKRKPVMNESHNIKHVKMAEGETNESEEIARMAEARHREEREKVEKEKIEEAVSEQPDIMEGRQNHAGENSPQKKVWRKACCLNCGEETEKSKKCRGCRKARYHLHSAVRWNAICCSLLYWSLVFSVVQ